MKFKMIISIKDSPFEDDVEQQPQQQPEMSITITRPSISVSLGSIDEHLATDYSLLKRSRSPKNEYGNRKIQESIDTERTCSRFERLHGITVDTSNNNDRGISPNERSHHLSLVRRNYNRSTLTPPLSKRRFGDVEDLVTKTSRSLSTTNLPDNIPSHRLPPKIRASSLRSSNASLGSLRKQNLTSVSSTQSFSSLCSDRHNGIQHSALNINDVMTWISFILPDCKDNSDTVIVVIPGNPGAIEFYDRFMENLFQYCKLPIFGISHAGHNLIPSKSSLVRRVYKELNPNIKSSDKHVFTLEEQIEHKLAFIRQYIDPNKKIILIAHSLGSYITLKMLERLDSEEADRVKQIILLFPVFERTMETQSGRKWVPLTQFLQRPVIRTTKLVELLPQTVKKSLIDFIAHQRRFSNDSKKSLSNGIDSLVTPNGLRNMSQIAKDLSKIGRIGDLENVIETFSERLTFYYGASDLWTPLSFYEEMKTRFPDIDIRLDGKGIDHAFVLSHSTLVAPIVGEILQEKIMMDQIAESGSIDSYRDYFFNFGFKRSQMYKSRASIRRISNQS
uniref:Lipid droplet-associated hydrolase n=2 Tax=Clytia hemisphaerica TaxID=252671 RepID=A0A7M5VE20_9CNID